MLQRVFIVEEKQKLYLNFKVKTKGVLIPLVEEKQKLYLNWITAYLKSSFIKVEEKQKLYLNKWKINITKKS